MLLDILGDLHTSAKIITCPFGKLSFVKIAQSDYLVLVFVTKTH